MKGKFLLMFGIFILLVSLVSVSASWPSSLSTNLEGYWKFDEGAGTMVNDSLGLNNFNLFNTPEWVGGKLGSGLNFSRANSQYGLNSSAVQGMAFNDINDSITINYWLYLNSTGAEYQIVDGGNKFTVYISSADVLALTINRNGASSRWNDATGGFTTTGSWHMITLRYNGTGALGTELFVDGSPRGVTPQGYNDAWIAENSPIYLASLNGASRYVDGGLDEMGIWSRALTDTEIGTTLYNGGTGITYLTAPTLNTPADNFVTINSLVNFNTTITSINTVFNVSLILDGLYDQTNTSGFNGTYLFSKTFVEGQYNWTVEMCETGGCLNSTTRTFNVSKVKINSVTYNSTVPEGSLEGFKVNLTYNSTKWVGIVIKLVYNGTEYVGSTTDTGNIRTYSRSINVPTVSATGNRSFYWNIALSNSTSTYYSNSTTYNQTITNFDIDNCGVHTKVLYNFTLKDEQTQGIINKTTKNTQGKLNLQLYSPGSGTLISNYTTLYNQTNPFAVCFSNNLSTGGSYLIDVQVEYSGTGYATEYYHIQQDTITIADFPTNISLYDLNSSSNQPFIISYKDSSFLPVSGALIQVQRRYVDEGITKTVEIPKTDNDGKTIANLEIDDVIYSFTVTKDSVVLATFNDFRAVCQNPNIEDCVINLNSFSSTLPLVDFSDEIDFSFTLTYNETSRTVSSTFTVPSGSVSTVSLNVTKDNALGTEVCNTIVTTTAGTLNCVVGSSFGNTTVVAKLYKNNVLVGHGRFKLDRDSSDLYGTSMVVLGLFLMLTLVGAGLSSNPIYTVVSLMIGIILLFALNLVSNNGFIGGTATVLWIFIAIILVIIKGANRN